MSSGNGRISTSVVVEGEREYREAVKNITTAQKELLSEMRMLTTQFKDAANSEEALRAKNDVLSKQIVQTEKNIESIEKVISKYKSTLKEAEAKVEEMKRQHGEESIEAKNAQAQYDELTRGLQTYQAKLNQAKAELIDENKALEQNEHYLREAENSIDKCADSIDRFGRETKETGDAVELIAKSDIFNVLSEKAEKVAETLMECVEAADQFEYGMSKVQSIAQTDDASLAEMGEQIQQLAVTYGASANEIAEATYQAISASVDAGEATAFVEDAMKLARGGFTDTVTAVDVLTTTLNAYGKEANTTEHIMNALVTTQNLGKTTVGELAQNMGQVIPTAAALNVSLDNLASAYVQLTKNGINTANATTYIKGMLNELSDSGSGVAAVLKQETGKSFGQLMADGKSLGDVIQILGDHVDGNSEKFKNMFSNVRAGSGALTIYNNTAEAFNKSMKAVADSTGAADKAFEIMADTSEMTSKRMDAAVENLKVTIGEALQPTIDQVKEKGISALETVTDFIEKNPALVSALGGAAAAVTGVATAVSVCAGAVVILEAAFGDLTGAVRVLGTSAALGLLAGTIAAVSNENDSLAASVERTSQAIKDMADKNKESAMSFSETERELLTVSENARKYAETIKSLQSVEELSTEQKAEMRRAVEKLNSVLPDLNLTIDEQTGKLNENSRATLDNVDAMLKLQKAEVYRERNKELVEQMVDAEEKLSEARQKRIAIEQQLTETEKEFAETQRTADSQYNLDLETRRAEATNELKKTLEEAREAETQASVEVQNLSDSYDRNTRKIDENTEAVEENADTQGEAGQAAGLTAEELEELAKKYDKARESAISSLQSQKDKFQELGEAARKGVKDSTESIEKFSQHIADQRKGIEEYSQNVESALEFMLDNKWSEGLLSSIIEKGPEASGDLKMILDTIDKGEEGVKKFKETCEDFDAFAPISEQVGEYQARLQEGIPITEEAIKKNKELYDSRGFLITAYQEGEDAFTTYADSTKETAAKLPEDAAKAVTSTASQVAEAEEKMLTDAIQAGYTVLGMDGEGGESSVFVGLGESVVSSFATGLADTGGLVSNAISSLCQTAIDAIDISRISDKLQEAVNKTISEAEAKVLNNVMNGASRQANMGGK